MALPDLKKHLAVKSEKELRQEIATLYKTFKNVKEFYDSQLNPQEELEVLDQYKLAVTNEFFPKYGYGEARLSVARKSVLDYKKIMGVHQNLVDLAIHYVEQGVKYTLAYGDINEAFYNSMESMFAQALKWAKIITCLPNIQQRAKLICQNTDFMGWGFHDQLSETYSEFYGEKY